MSRKRTTDVIWADGRPRQPPKADEDLARRLAQNPKALLDGPPLAWLKRKLEMVPPDWIGTELPASTPQKVIEHNEVDVGQETDLDFMDADIETVRRPVIWTVTNNPGVRDIVQGRVETRFVNPGDIEIDPLLAPYIEVEAGTTDFTITDTSLGAILDPTYIAVGRKANLHAGFGLQVAAVYTDIDYADNCRVALYEDDNAGASSPTGAGNASWDLPGVGAYYGQFTTGWQTTLTPSLTGDPEDYYFIRVGGEPYLDTFAAKFEGQVYWRWVYMPDSDYSDKAAYIRAGLPTPANEGSPAIVNWDPDTGGWTSATETFVVARVGARLNSGGSEYQRQRINFIEGSGIDITVADDSVNEEIDVTIAKTVRGRFNGLLYGVPNAGTSRFLLVPRVDADAVGTFNLERCKVRTETPSSSGDVTFTLQHSPGGEAAPSWTDIDTGTLPDGEYEVDVTLDYDVDSDDLLRIYFTGIGTGVGDYQALFTGDRTA